MKVCFVAHSAAMGGAERTLLELADALKSRGVTGYAVLPWWGPLRRTLKSRGMTVSVMPYVWWMGKRGRIWERIGRTLLNLVMVLPIAIRIKLWRCDLVCTNTLTINVGAIAAKCLDRPHVWYLHEFGDVDHGLVFDLGERLSLALMNGCSAAVIACSEAVARKFIPHVGPGKIKVIYGAVRTAQDARADEGQLPALGDGVIRCVMVGNLREGKRHEDAIRAVGELRRTGLHAALLIVGQAVHPRHSSSLRRLAKTQGVEAAVQFTGYLGNPSLLMQQGDVVLMCSRCEAFGRVTVEAMRAGKPVIGTRSGGTPELIRDGWNGLLYTPGDSKELAQHIRYLAEHPELARRMGRNGQAWTAERFTEQRYGDEVLTVLRQVVHQRHRRSSRASGI